jgi:hypothetical protein
MSIYLSSDTQWPILQSKREQKFKNGLMAVSAEFISPKNQSFNLTEIESSEGSCDIYPLPSISFDTSPFQTISATGYKLWESRSDENIFQQPVDLIFEVAFLDFEREEGSTRKLFPLRQSYRYASKKIQIIAESGTVSKTFDGQATIPTLSRPLTITQTKNQWAANEIFNFGYQYEQIPTELKSPTATEFLSSVSSQSFTPTISIYSATYSVTYNLYFGLFVESTPTT